MILHFHIKKINGEVSSWGLTFIVKNKYANWQVFDDLEGNFIGVCIKGKYS